MSLLLLLPWQLFVWSDWIPCFPLILVPCVQKPLLYIACHICISYILQYIVLRAIFARVRQNAKNAKLKSLLIFLYKSDSIAVSLFTNSIRRQGPNNYSGPFLVQLSMFSLRSMLSLICYEAVHALYHHQKHIFCVLQPWFLFNGRQQGRLLVGI